ncbi:LON peptidase substrate-binding domain-containing protein [bacterium]|nr:LON peptidase substrate-binding domain-containing protein [bacterium]
MTPLRGTACFAWATSSATIARTPDRCAAPVGTIGLIRASREAENGTSNLLLHGVFRVYFEEWLEDKPYPYARIRPILDTTLAADEESEYLGRLRRTINRTLSGFPSEVNEQINTTLDKAGDSATCSDAVAQQFIHDPNDRQRLLETPEVRKRIDFLIQFLEKAGPSV